MDLLKEKTLKKLAIGSFYNSVYWVVLDLADFLYKKTGYKQVLHLLVFVAKVSEVLHFRRGSVAFVLFL